MRTPTNSESIFLVDLTLLAFSVVGSRIVRDVRRNADDLHFSIRQLSIANIELRITAEALRENEQQIVSIYNTVRDVIFHRTGAGWNLPDEAACGSAWCLAEVLSLLLRQTES